MTFPFSYTGTRTVRWTILGMVLWIGCVSGGDPSTSTEPIAAAERGMEAPGTPSPVTSPDPALAAAASAPLPVTFPYAVSVADTTPQTDLVTTPSPDPELSFVMPLLEWTRTNTCTLTSSYIPEFMFLYQIGGFLAPIRDSHTVSVYQNCAPFQPTVSITFYGWLQTTDPSIWIPISATQQIPVIPCPRTHPVHPGT